MEPSIRPAVAADRDAIASFTTDTFTWGDYVADAFDRWLADSDGGLLVADLDGRVVGVVRGVMLAPREAWLQGARVHPDHRRQGVGSALHAAALDWARDAGAAVVRLLVEDDNTTAQAQVESSGMRPVTRFVHASRSVGDASPAPAGNGGRRVGAMEKLRRTHSSEAEPAFMAWSAGELARAGRGLFGVGWQFRRLTVGDLTEAAREEALWAARSGWVLAARREEILEVGWLSTTPDDAHDLLRAVVDLAVDEGAERVRAMLPDVAWLSQAARRANYSVAGEILYAVDV